MIDASPILHMPSDQLHGSNSFRRIHFIGIGGAGMSGIAEVLKNIGYVVSGSDIEESTVTKRLQSLGIKIWHGHDAKHVLETEVVVISTAIAADNPEVLAAKQNHIPIVRRAEMLAELMRFMYGIAITGTHGKTTVASLVSSILADANLDPTCVIGGLLNSLGSHAKLGKSKYIVVEADESDASFLHLPPIISVITNIDLDHLDNYAGDINSLRRHFLEFIYQLPFYGLAILCSDDEGVQAILADISRPYVTYGFNDLKDEAVDYRAEFVRQEGEHTWFKYKRKDQSDWTELDIRMPGRHNVQNALAAIVVADKLGISEQCISHALKNFAGIRRRFNVHGKITIANKSVLLIDDYSHHPTEITATIKAVHDGWHNKQLLVIYQPHRYTRLRDLFDDFVQALSQVDRLLIMDVYAAGEEFIHEADSHALCRAIRLRNQVTPIFVEDKSAIDDILSGVVKDDDIVLIMGAGDIGTVAEDLYEKYH